MKKLLLISLLLSSSAFAATQGTLLLKGIINQVLSLTVTPVAGVNDALDLTTTATDLKVAEVNEESNSSTGYKILIKTANGGQLKNGTLGQVAYTMKYDGAAVTLGTTDVVAKNVATGGVYNYDSDVEISYTGAAAANLAQGTYTDTVTFTIQAN